MPINGAIWHAPHGSICSQAQHRFRCKADLHFYTSKSCCLCGVRVQLKFNLEQCMHVVTIG